MSIKPESGRILTVCVSKPKIVNVSGRSVSTGIFKEPVSGKLALRTLNLAGDEQADLVVHGGPEKAVYSYASEHYPWWREQMPDVTFSHGIFGENLTTRGLLEDEVYIGDEFQAGSAIIRVTQPRLPCYKLGIRFRRADVIRKFMQSGRSGIYFGVVKEGELGADDELLFLRSDEHKIKVSDIANLFTGRSKRDPELIERAMRSQLAAQMKMFIAAPE
ncbi:MAG TPA: MOSC domain-containing protein [Oculatellaceae cyanobacterium]